MTASWEAYCPFGGFETLYKFIAPGGQTVSHTHLSNLVVLVAALVADCGEAGVPAVKEGS